MHSELYSVGPSRQQPVTVHSIGVMQHEQVSWSQVQHTRDVRVHDEQLVTKEVLERATGLLPEPNCQWTIRWKQGYFPGSDQSLEGRDVGLGGAAPRAVLQST